MLSLELLPTTSRYLFNLRTTIAILLLLCPHELVVLLHIPGNPRRNFVRYATVIATSSKNLSYGYPHNTVKGRHPSLYLS